ncbi:MAG: hypothetical protein JXR35_07720 [Rhodobacteraceae bacterium]|nr:hypothetical protein [Paracoccaceae bacterium]
MAETGTTRPDIEDVLSSIRRLVSQDTRPSVSVQTLTSEPDTLVLTPAQLVSQDTSVDVTEPPRAKVAKKAHGSPVGKTTQSLESAAISPSDAPRPTPMSAPQDWEPDFDDSAAPNWPQTDDLAVQVPATDAGLGDELTQLEDTIARLAAEVSESEAEFESETGDPFTAAGMAPLADLPESFDEADLRVENTDFTQPDMLGSGPLEDDDSGLESVTEARMNADTPSTASANDPSDIDPDLQHADWAESALEDPHWPDLDLSPADAIEDAELVSPPTSPRRLHLGDAAEVHSDAPHRASTYESTREEIALEDEFPELADIDSNEENSDLIEAALPIDEDALHALVSDLIRKELRGLIGERITRNVRKLVRREIQRALVSRDLE